MRAGIVTGKEQFELVEMSDPAPRDGQVVVAIQRCGICGSDVHAYQEGWPYSPAICGHEWVGTIADVGSGVGGTELAERLVPLFEAFQLTNEKDDCQPVQKPQFDGERHEIEHLVDPDYAEDQVQDTRDHHLGEVG